MQRSDWIAPGRGSVQTQGKSVKQRLDEADADMLKKTIKETGATIELAYSF